jgi:hypothetical protein
MDLIAKLLDKIVKEFDMACHSGQGINTAVHVERLEL